MLKVRGKIEDKYLISIDGFSYLELGYKYVLVKKGNGFTEPKQKKIMLRHFKDLATTRLSAKVNYDFTADMWIERIV